MSNKRSLFDQSLDRSVFVTYFLGGVVPLLGFALLSEHVLSSLGDRNDQWALIAAVCATGILSLVSFFALRRVVLRAITRMNHDNTRLEALLGVARELADAPHSQVVVDMTAYWALQVASADASWVFGRTDLEKPFTLMGQRGDEASAWLADHEDAWVDLVDRATRDSESTSIQDRDKAGLSIVIAPLAGDELPEGAVIVARKGKSFYPVEVDAISTLAAQAGVALTNAERGDVQRNFFSHMTELVVAALDTHIQYRSGHASRVAETANRVGRAMGLEDDALHDLHFASLLHDVGMLRIPLEHQKDPKYYRKHSVVGYKMLSRIRAWEKAAPIVLQHHERPDGTGYPDGAVGDDICLGARILAVCDCWDAMRSDDWNHEALPVEDALTELAAHAGTQFDSDVVATFTSLVEQDQI